jgi:hypothetical protein
VHLRPHSLGALTGFRFDFRFQGGDGLIYLGTAIMVERGKYLNLVVYMAPLEHYNPCNRAAVETKLNHLSIRE